MTKQEIHFALTSGGAIFLTAERLLCPPLNLKHLISEVFPVARHFDCAVKFKRCISANPLTSS